MLIEAVSTCRILYVRNLPFNISSEEVPCRTLCTTSCTQPNLTPTVAQHVSLCRCMRFLDDLGQYGRYDSELNAVVPFISWQCAGLRTLNCLCRGSTKETRGTAYVVYEDIYDAKTAVEHLSGFNVANRYLIVLYYNHQKHSKKVSFAAGNTTSIFIRSAVAVRDTAQTSILCLVEHYDCTLY